MRFYIDGGIILFWCVAGVVLQIWRKCFHAKGPFQILCGAHSELALNCLLRKMEGKALPNEKSIGLNIK